MTVKIGDRIRQTTTTTGTGALNLIAPAAGDVSAANGVGSGNKLYYVIDDGAGNWEEGYGTVTAGTPDTLSRTTVLNNSLGTTALINFVAGTKTIICDVPASKRVFLDENGNIAAVPFAVAGSEVARFGTDGSLLVGGTANVGAGNVGAKAFVIPAASGLVGSMKYSNGSNVANGGAVTLDTATGGGSYCGILCVSLTDFANGNISQNDAFALTGRGSSFVNTLIGTQVRTGGCTYTLGISSLGLITLTNTHGAGCTMSLGYFGAGGG